MSLLKYVSNSHNPGNFFKINNILLYLDHNKNNYQQNTVMVDEFTASKYAGNFYGLLSTLKYDSKFHFYIMYVNDLNNPTEYDGLKRELEIPNLNLIEILNTLIDM